jgi:hypothetical protein
MNSSMADLLGSSCEKGGDEPGQRFAPGKENLFSQDRRAIAKFALSMSL